MSWYIKADPEDMRGMQQPRVNLYSNYIYIKKLNVIDKIPIAELQMLVFLVT